MIKSLLELAIDGATLVLVVIGIVLAATVASIPAGVLLAALESALRL